MVVVEIVSENGSVEGVRYAVDLIEDELSRQVGPIAKFIVNRALVQMGKKRGDDFTFEELMEFIRSVSEIAISDPEVRDGVVKTITMRLEIRTTVEPSS